RFARGPSSGRLDVRHAAMVISSTIERTRPVVACDHWSAICCRPLADPECQARGPAGLLGVKIMFKPKVLVAYASKSGTTIDVAHAVAEALREQGLVVDVRHVSKLNHLEGYQAVVVGSGVRAGHWLPAAVHFVEEHQEALRQMPVAFFTVCMTMTEDTPENREI